MRSRMSFVMALCAVLAILVFSGTTAAQEGLYVRVAHLSPLSPMVDVFVNGSKVLEGLDYRSVSAYLPMPTTQLELVVVPAGGDLADSVTERPVELQLPSESGFFTLAAIGILDDLTFDVIVLPQDAFMEPSAMSMPEMAAVPEKASATLDTIRVSGAYARATTDAMSGMGSMDATPEGGMTMPMNDVSAIYMLIENTSDQADVLLSVTSDVSDDTQIHQTVVDAAGVASMNHLMGGVEIPAQGSLEMAPGGYHVMMMNLKRPLAVGETVQVTLTFQSGVTLMLDVPVLPVAM